MGYGGMEMEEEEEEEEEGCLGAENGYRLNKWT